MFLFLEELLLTFKVTVECMTYCDYLFELVCFLPPAANLEEATTFALLTVVMVVVGVFSSILEVVGGGYNLFCCC